jgi:hypothetical protein
MANEKNIKLLCKINTNNFIKGFVYECRKVKLFNKDAYEFILETSMGAEKTVTLTDTDTWKVFFKQPILNM